MLYALRCTVGMAAFKGLVPPHHNDSALSLVGRSSSANPVPMNEPHKPFCL